MTAALSVTGLLAVSLCACSTEVQAREKSAAEFVLEKIAVPEDADSEKLVRGSAAEKQARLSKLGASYDKKFDLTAIPAYRPATRLTGTLRIWGNNYIQNSGIGPAWSDAFKKYHPGLEIEMVLPTAAMATGALSFGLADVAMTHQPTFYDSLSHLRVLGYEPTGFMAVTGAYDMSGFMNTIAILVNKDLPIDALTMDQLDGIYGSQRQGGWQGTTWRPDFARGPEKDIRSWGQLGVKGPCANQPIVPIGYAVIYSTATEFSRQVLRSSGRWSETLHDYGNATLPDGKRISQDTQILDTLAHNPCGIAYLRFEDGVPLDKFKPLKLARDDKSPAIAFTLDTVYDRSYPLAGEMSFYASVKPGEKMDPKAREWISFILSREAQELIQDIDRKYLPLNPNVAAAERARLARF